MKLTGEPTNEQIDDYNDKESPEKRREVYFIMGALILIGITSYIFLS